MRVWAIIERMHYDVVYIRNERAFGEHKISEIMDDAVHINLTLIMPFEKKVILESASIIDLLCAFYAYSYLWQAFLNTILDDSKWSPLSLASLSNKGFLARQSVTIDRPISKVLV
ncbi:uncharacterized protein LOC127252714 [Andrographis paniculata]|uniref:uncharacterized protein LOC127252714 n=1 Tax=Andrographis paniculata TaxID=175694 RepID=UPI0021E7187B|nr:uncharacterized protein LOC127252714 [Andrographis paniculata]